MKDLLATKYNFNLEFIEHMIAILESELMQNTKDSLVKMPVIEKQLVQKKLNYLKN